MVIIREPGIEQLQAGTPRGIQLFASHPFDCSQGRPERQKTDSVLSYRSLAQTWYCKYAASQ